MLVVVAAVGVAEEREVRLPPPQTLRPAPVNVLEREDRAERITRAADAVVVADAAHVVLVRLTAPEVNHDLLRLPEAPDLGVLAARLHVASTEAVAGCARRQEFATPQ